MKGTPRFINPPPKFRWTGLGPAAFCSHRRSLLAIFGQVEGSGCGVSIPQALSPVTNKLTSMYRHKCLDKCIHIHFMK